MNLRLDPRPGGEALARIVSMDGVISFLPGRVLEIEEPRRLALLATACSHEDEPAFEVRVSVDFEDASPDGDTLVTVELTVASAMTSGTSGAAPGDAPLAPLEPLEPLARQALVRLERALATAPRTGPAPAELPGGMMRR